MNDIEFLDHCKQVLADFGDEIWVWGRYGNVGGYYSDGVVNNAVVIWITERPAYPLNKFPDARDREFYNLLEKHGLANIHMADFVKIPAKSGEPPGNELIKVSAILMQEEIKRYNQVTKNLIIVANTRPTEEWVGEYLAAYWNKTRYIRFFKHRFTKQTQLEDALKDLKKLTLCEVSEDWRIRDESDTPPNRKRKRKL